MLFHGELERQLLEKEKELHDMQINLMLSQIGPHFVNNTLNTKKEKAGHDKCQNQSFLF